ncbi:hypothetical protein AJ88_20435 [Mesorhizobium amorphae CCBAU 01583]|nr:hypothetical protein AJ88_20435 [Mesorhizobium amorphae CCBAU 01583]
MQIIQNRRRFLAGAVSAGAAGLIGTSTQAWAEPLPETTSVRLPRYIGGAYCWAGLYLAGEMLRAEGFTDVRYVQGDKKVDHSAWIANGETDFSVNYVPIHLASIDAGVPIRVLSGLHSGCLELIANDRVKGISDLRGKRVGVFTLDSPQYVLVSLMAAYVGLDPVNDIEWVIEEHNFAEGFVEGKYDAVLGQPPRTQELRSRKVGHTILNSTTDPPWSRTSAACFGDCGLCRQISGGDKARPAVHPQGRRPLCLRSVVDCRAAGRSRFRPQLRTRAANAW